jgi:hypothetical protein
MAIEDMTEEEYMRLIAAQQMQQDPMAFSLNNYGQGSDYLWDEETPSSWDRRNDKVDIYGDLFRMTKTWMPDFVDGLHPTPEDPGLFKGYRSDKADLFRNNEAYRKLEQLMGEGAPFEEAVTLVSSDPAYAGMLPQDQDFPGRVDNSEFRRSAEEFLSERGREGREYDVWDQSRQEFDDFNRPRTGLDFAPVREGNINKFLKKTPMAPQFVDTKDTESLYRAKGREKAAKENTWQGPSTGGPNGRPGLRSNNRSGNRLNRDVKRKEKTRASNAQARKTNYDSKVESTNLYNKMLKQAYEQTVANKQKVKAPSKKKENLGALVKFYNQMIYGE